MRSWKRVALALSLAAGIGLALPACGEKEPETPGDVLKKAGDDLGDAVDDAAKKADEALKKDD